MRRFPVVPMLSALAVLAALWTGSEGFGVPAASQGCGWKVVQGRNDTKGDLLLRVDASSPDGVWAAGSHFEGGKGVAFTQRWTGGEWEVVSPRIVDLAYNGFQDVAAISPDDVWAVGTITGDRTLTQHWDGTQWSIAPSPNVGDENELLGVSAASGTDVWAVGKSSATYGADYRTLIERSDGQTWQVIPSPNAGSRSNVLRDVDASSRADVWAVGWRVAGSDRYRTLIQRWDGTGWAVVPSPNAGGRDNFLSAVTAISKRDAWAVGWALDAADVGRTLVQHWDGRRWRIVESPNAGTAMDSLLSVDSASARDVWAVGASVNDGGTRRTLIQHWDGRTWRIVESPNQGSGDNVLQGVSATPRSDVWAVGTRVDAEGAYRSLIQRHC